MGKPEQHLQLQICQYLRLQFPKVVFFSEPSGLRVSLGQAVLLKKMRSFGKLPDMFIAYPNGKYHGFFIELKVEGTTIWKRDGELVADKHIRAQFETLVTLHDLGYAATFGIGFEHTKRKIDGYFSMTTMAPAAPELDFMAEKEKKEGEKETEKRSKNSFILSFRKVCAKFVLSLCQLCANVVTIKRNKLSQKLAKALYPS